MHLSKRQVETLREMAFFEKAKMGPYRWRRVSSLELCQLGLAVAVASEAKHQPYRVTEAGFRWLKKNPRPTHTEAEGE